MKLNHQAALMTASLTVIIAMTAPCYAVRPASTTPTATFPAMPSGWLVATPTVVQTGTKPTLSWGVNYPSIVEDYVTVTQPATLQTDVELDCEIRVLGAGVTATASGSTSYTFVPTEALFAYGTSTTTYFRIFYGTNPQVNPNTVVWSKTIPKNTKLKFGGRYYYNKTWSTKYTSDSGTQNVRLLVNNSIPPSNVPDYNAPSLESFIKPYLSPAGRVQIGPMDVIVFMELTHPDSKSSEGGYDLQDMVLLVTFKSKAKTNNGHGNNIDGIDSSNPGNAPFINLDTDPTVDDERP